jgi:hypothetical protein
VQTPQEDSEKQSWSHLCYHYFQSASKTKLQSFQIKSWSPIYSLTFFLSLSLSLSLSLFRNSISSLKKQIFHALGSQLQGSNHHACFDCRWGRRKHTLRLWLWGLSNSSSNWSLSHLDMTFILLCP